MSTFKIARIDAEKDVKLVDFEFPVLEKDEIKIKVVACGICTSDQGIYTGRRANRYPFYPGHEVVGIVEEVAEFSGTIVKPGDKVVVSRMHKCGQCESCRRGATNRCLNSQKMYRPGRPKGQGGMAEYLIVPHYQVHPLRDDIDMESASLIEPVACSVASVEKADVRLGDTVLVIGAGIMGLLHADLLRLKGARVIVSEFDEERREIAKNHSDYVVNPAEPITEEILEITNGYGVNSVFVTAGPPNLVEEMFSYVAPGADIVIYTSYYQKTGPNASINLNELHYKEYSIIGTISPTEVDFKKAIDLVQNKKVDLRPFVSATYPLSQVKEGFEKSIQPDVFRVVLKMENS